MGRCRERETQTHRHECEEKGNSRYVRAVPIHMHVQFKTSTYAHMDIWNNIHICVHDICVQEKKKNSQRVKRPKLKFCDTYSSTAVAGNTQNICQKKISKKKNSRAVNRRDQKQGENRKIHKGETDRCIK